MVSKSRRLNPARTALAGLALAGLPLSAFAFVSVGLSITVAPPALPVYVQPPCPAVGYIWTPGYWAYGDDDYYWVPGTWVLAPSPGLLWTPGYWGWGDGLYVWHAGYWGPHVGFYGGIDYGYGYGGVGFEGGYWRGGAFYYNRSVANLGGVHITNVYNRTVVNNYNVTRVSFNGGEGGTRARPSTTELAAEHDHHVAFTNMQRSQEHAAFTNHDLRASVNQGKPRIAATQRPGAFTGRGVEPAERGGLERGSGGHSGPGHAGSEHIGTEHLATRNDRPPGASGNAVVRGGNGGSRGPENHVDSHFATRNDRPAGTGGSHTEQSHVAVARNERPSQPGGGSAMSHSPEPRSNEAHPMAPRPRSAPQPSARQFNGGGGEHTAPRPEIAPRPQMAPRSQMPPRMEAAPRPPSEPRSEARGGGGEPRGQGGGGRPQPQGRDAGEHGRR